MTRQRVRVTRPVHFAIQPATQPGTATIQRLCKPRHDLVGAETRRCARGLGAVLAQRVRSLGHGCVHCALDSFDLVHCFESLFGSLFMNTVYEHCS